MFKNEKTWEYIQLKGEGQMADGLNPLPNKIVSPLNFNAMRKPQPLLKAEWQRLAAVPQEEKDKAFKKLARWVHYFIIRRGYDPKKGPFSFDAMGGNAVDVICNECFEALFTGERHWKANYSLSTTLIDIATSKILHIIRDYERDGQPKIHSTGDDDFYQEFERTVAAQLEREANLRDMGYEMARDAVKAYPKLVAYIDALYESNDYAAIAKRLGISKPKVMQLEQQLLEILEEM
jgi:DNA-directed RNA polymerase specialized sigma24 family protein